MGACGAGALLSPSHAAVSHPPRRGAHGTFPGLRTRSHRLLARPQGQRDCKTISPSVLSSSDLGRRYREELPVKVGVPTEIKTDEYRVALTPAGVRELVEHEHEVVVQSGAGDGSAIADEEYVSQGARIVPDAAAVFAESEMVVKVKEPQAVEVAMLEPRHTLFTYLHLAPDPELTRGLVESGATCVAYETVEDARGRLPLLAPMSEVAGKIATQAGAFMLEKP